MKVKVKAGAKRGCIFQEPPYGRSGRIVVQVFGPNTAARADVLAHELAHLKLRHPFIGMSGDGWGEEYERREVETCALARRSGRLRHRARQIVKRADKKASGNKIAAEEPEQLASPEGNGQRVTPEMLEALRQKFLQGG